ncbi:MAG: response regulator [Deltaproteobacteria bacterium]|nr:response regulator [Deltaproteobacteria bacterium]
MQVEAIQQHESIVDQDFNSMTVMVVDDDPMVGETLGMFFEHLNFKKIVLLDRGEKALEEIDSEFFDYIFMDLMMPGIGGLETLKLIHENHQLTNVIIMTGYPTMETVIDAMRSGASDFLVKPFRLQDIKIILERISRLKILMEKNWRLNQELAQKQEVEKLNIELEKRIRSQTMMYNIVDSLSRINKTEDLCNFIVKKSMETCQAQKACFLIHDDGNNDNYILLSQTGLQNITPGTLIPVVKNKAELEVKRSLFQSCFGINFDSDNGRKNHLDSKYLSIPFNIRTEPFGLLLVGEKADTGTFDSDDEFILKFMAERTALNIENMALYDNLMQSLMASLKSLVGAIEAKDKYTRQHSSRVTHYAIEIARIMGCSDDDLQRIRTCAPLHDIGKIGINDGILNKTAKLTEEEYEIIKSHPLIGVNIVSPLGLDKDELSIIRNHHERWDGKGYPDGLAADKIPHLSRILVVADSFDAMSSDRAYRKAIPFEKCIEELIRNKGTQFDPEVVDASIELFAEIKDPDLVNIS